MDTAKLKIQKIVTNYKKVFFDEFESFKKSNSINISKNKDKFGQVDSGIDLVERKMIELPESLYIMLQHGLDPEEFSWLFPQNNPQNTGLKWFVRSYPEFRAMEKL
jgi:hypothetical protein